MYGGGGGGGGCSQTILRDSSVQLFSAFKHSEEEFTKNGDSDNRLRDELGSGLLRYRSAPSSFFASFEGSGAVEDFLNSNESDDMCSGSMVPDVSASDSLEMNFPMMAKNEAVISKPPYPQRNEYSKTRSRETAAEFGLSKVKSNLVRQASSPAGLFSNLSVQNGFSAMKDMRSACFSSLPSYSSSRFLPQITENGNEGIEENDDNNKNSYYIPEMLNDDWDNSTTRITGLKRSRDNSHERFTGSYSLPNQHDEDEARRYSTGLTHHLSLPKTYSMEVVDKFLLSQQDSVPCKIRAKRGCATHPRSIAERMRRTRISERMRKLQELFPNMDKQTNTADMLELAVRSIKDLQKQVQTLKENRERCTCSFTKKMIYN